MKLAGVCAVLVATGLYAQKQQAVETANEQRIEQQLRGVRHLPDAQRVGATKVLAVDIRRLPPNSNKVSLAYNLASLATEGDFGHDTLQEVAATLAQALREQPLTEDHGQPAAAYLELAQLARYEHVRVSLDAPQFAAAMSKIEADEQIRQGADFTLTDLRGNSWTLKSLRGKVVLVNFWATWCPPCRKEMPDLDALYLRFKDQGFVILAISDEEAEKVKAFVEESKITYPVLIDPRRKVNERFQIQGIPKSFVYDRNGKLVAQSIDMRTQRQFLEMLAQAGLR